MIKGERWISPEERFRLFMANVKDHAIFFTDKNGMVVDWNEGAEQLTGYTEEDVLGKSASVIFTPEDLARGAADMELKQAEKEGRASDERWHIRKDGTLFWGSGVMEAVKDEKGNLIGFVKIIRDFTARKQTESELMRRTEELARSNHELEQFAHVASHDLQSPLMTVSNYLGLINEELKGRHTPNSEKYITRVLDLLSRMKALIDDLLDYAKVGTERQTFSDVDLGTAVRLATVNLRQEIKAAEARITVGALPTVKGDEALLVLVFQNLISNALKYRSKEPPFMDIQARRRENEWMILVRDNGIGVAPAYTKEIFKPFYRLHSKSAYPGTGIGLAICEKIINQHGGRIWVQPQTVGSLFCFTLPVVLRTEARINRMGEKMAPGI